MATSTGLADRLQDLDVASEKGLSSKTDRISAPSGSSVEVVDLSGDGGVTKQVLRRAKASAAGPSSQMPVCELQYEGRLADTGEVFDSTRDDNTSFAFEVGAGNVIRAWELAVPTMKVGELALVTCRHDYAYGEKGSPPDIPPRATLVFEMELIDVRPPKGVSATGSAAGDMAKLEELRKERDAAAQTKEEAKKKREEAKAAAAARLQAKMEAKKGGGKGKHKK